MRININDIDVKILEVTTKDSGEQDSITQFIIHYHAIVTKTHMITGEYYTDDIAPEAELKERILNDIAKAQ